MKETNYCIEEMRTNLQDAGCSEEFIDQFVHCFQQSNQRDQANLLNQHKRQLNQAIFQKQKQIDCLDYLCFKLKL
ncbi:hypothetical protein JZO70_16000 [Enterococcus sp. 669A]|uniref:Uncharacterized protein n=1 Tax=Candidatus Enterococcus moelleringii TaxID=2815325 RepID=A0ABS3LF32_9ENTE|nr:hypothetical protein [Enterococcus sp. 669A]MBO1307680.1 hypothetical protein [Enterococcus sp. 669A]